MLQVGSELRWNFATRVAFRFLLSYFLLHAGTALFQLVPLVGPSIGTQLDSALRPFFVWVAKVVFGLEITVFPNGSGDTTYNWVQLATNLAIAIVATVAWTACDRRNLQYPRLKDGLWIAMRFSLAYAMLSYGIDKILLLQFAEPGMHRLLHTYGESSPMRLMWTFMEASDAYTRIAGWLEAIGGLLLCFRQTQLIGALWTAGVMLNVFLLNMCYDIPVKIYSFHLLAMALVIAAPDAPRLMQALLWNRPVGSADLLGPWTNRKLCRIALVGKLAWLGLVLSLMTSDMRQMATTYGANAPRGAHDGTWEVREFRRDGVELPPLVTDSARWRYLTFIDRADWKQVDVKPMKGTDRRWQMETEEGGRMLLRPFAATANEDSSKAAPAGTLVVTRVGEKTIHIQGDLEGSRIEAVCDRIEERDLLLVSRGFHWVNERPFSR